MVEARLRKLAHKYHIRTTTGRTHTPKPKSELVAQIKRRIRRLKRASKSKTQTRRTHRSSPRKTRRTHRRTHRTRRSFGTACANGLCRVFGMSRRH